MNTTDGLIVSVSGIRGVVGEVADAGGGAGLRLGAGRPRQAAAAIVVSRDGRPSGDMLRHAVLAGLTAAGCEVHDLGVAADADGRPRRAHACTRPAACRSPPATTPPSGTA